MIFQKSFFKKKKKKRLIFAFITVGQIRTNRRQSERERSGKVLELGFEPGTPIVQRITNVENRFAAYCNLNILFIKVKK